MLPTRKAQTSLGDQILLGMADLIYSNSSPWLQVRLIESGMRLQAYKNILIRQILPEVTSQEPGQMPVLETLFMVDE